MTPNKRNHFTQNLPKTLKSFLSPNLDSSDTGDCFCYVLDGHREEEDAYNLQSLVQYYGQKHLANCDHVAKKHIGGKGDKKDDFACSVKEYQIHCIKVGTSQNLGNFLPVKERRK